MRTNSVFKGLTLLTTKTYWRLQKFYLNNKVIAKKAFSVF